MKRRRDSYDGHDGHAQDVQADSETKRFCVTRDSSQPDRFDEHNAYSEMYVNRQPYNRNEFEPRQTSRGRGRFNRQFRHRGGHRGSGRVYYNDYNDRVHPDSVHRGQQLVTSSNERARCSPHLVHPAFATHTRQSLPLERVVRVGHPQSLQRIERVVNPESFDCERPERFEHGHFERPERPAHQRRLARKWDEPVEIASALSHRRLPFPLVRYWMSMREVDQCLVRLLRYRPLWTNIGLVVPWLTGETFGSTCFRGTPWVLVPPREQYDQINCAVDYFTEYARINAKKHDCASPRDLWTQDDQFFEICLRDAAVDGWVHCRDLRNAIYSRCREATNFKLTRVKALLEMIFEADVTAAPGSKDEQLTHVLRNKRWLDPCAGWGDRLMSAVLFDMHYDGYECNATLERGHRQIVSYCNAFCRRTARNSSESSASNALSTSSASNALSMSSASGSRHKQKVHYMDFLEARFENDYDLVFTSPPCFNYEIYMGSKSVASDSTDAQQWLDEFLLPLIDKSWRHVATNGFLVLELFNFKGADFVGPALSRMDVDDAVYEGSLASWGAEDSSTPSIVFCWKKL